MQLCTNLIADYTAVSSTIPRDAPLAVTPAIEVNGAKRKLSKKDKIARDPNKPKRPASAYLLFQIDYRKQLAETNPGMPNNALMAALGEKWQQLTEEEKKVGVSQDQVSFVMMLRATLTITRSQPYQAKYDLAQAEWRTQTDAYNEVHNVFLVDFAYGSRRINLIPFFANRPSQTQKSPSPGRRRGRRRPTYQLQKRQLRPRQVRVSVPDLPSMNPFSNGRADEIGAPNRKASPTRKTSLPRNKSLNLLKARLPSTFPVFNSSTDATLLIHPPTTRSDTSESEDTESEDTVSTMPPLKKVKTTVVKSVPAPPKPAPAPVQPTTPVAKPASKKEKTKELAAASTPTTPAAVTKPKKKKVDKA